MIVLIDSSVLGILANPNKLGEAKECEEWLYKLLSKGVYVITSDLCDYEVRRGLVLAAKKNPNINRLEELDELQDIISFLPVNSAVFREAAILWAEARSRGLPTADEKSLDADMILCAQWKSLAKEFSGRYIVIATINVKHLSRFSEANLWREIIV